MPFICRPRTIVSLVLRVATVDHGAFPVLATISEIAFVSITVQEPTISESIGLSIDHFSIISRAIGINKFTV